MEQNVSNINGNTNDEINNILGSVSHGNSHYTISDVTLAVDLGRIRNTSMKRLQTPKFMAGYRCLVALIEALTALKAKIDEKIKETAKENYAATGQNSISNKDFKFTYVPGTTRESFDTKRFKQRYPRLYQEFLKTSNVSDTLRITKV